MADIDEKGVVLLCSQCGQRNRISFDKLEGKARCGQCKAEMPSLAEPVELRADHHFKALIDSSALPVLVDFWAPWCGPCKMVAPELEKVAANRAGELVVAKVNTEALPSLAQAFAVSSIPLLIVFARGSEIARLAGARPASGIESFVSEAMATR